MAFLPLKNSDHIVVSVTINFSSNSKQNAPFHFIAYDYFCADRDGLCDHLTDVPWEDVFELSASVAASEFCGISLKLMYISLIGSIRSSLTHLHVIQLFVLPP